MMMTENRNVKWPEKEIHALVTAHQRYGNDCSAIANYASGGRSENQCRQEKRESSFLVMKREHGLIFDDSARASEEEDDDSISSFVEKASENEEKADLKVQFWTDTEDQVLFEALERNSENWAAVAKFFKNAELQDIKNRSQLQCMNRFRDIVRTSSEKMKHIQKWNEAEEQELWNAHKLFKCDWDGIASHVANGCIATECKHKLYAMHVSRIANCKNIIVAKDKAKNDSQLGRTNVVDKSEAQAVGTRKPIHRRHRKKRARNLINPVTPESAKVTDSFSIFYSDTWSLNANAKECSPDNLSIIQDVSGQADNQVQVAEKRHTEVTEPRAPPKERKLEECKTELAELKAFMFEMKSEIMSTVAEMKSDIIAEIMADLRGIIAC